MNISTKGINFIKAFEGCYLRTYDDLQPSKVLNENSTIKGTLTIGIGHTGEDVKIGQVITLEKAFELFRNDIVYYEPKKEDLKQYEFDSLTSYRYNCGVNAKTDWKNRNAKIYSKGIMLNGLKRRRISEMILHFTGQYIVNSKPMLTYLNTTKYFSYNEVKNNQFLTMCVQWIVGCKAIDGIYGKETTSQVMKYQKINKLEIDGLVGINTWSKFKETVDF